MVRIVPGLHRLGDIDQLFTAAELSGGYEILYADNHHGDDHPGLGNARDFGHHPGLHDLAFDLAETGLQARTERCGRNQHAGGARHRIDDVADLQRELFDTTCHTGTDHGLCQFHLGLGEGGFGTRLLRRQDVRDAGFDALLCGHGRIDTALSGLDRQLKLFDLTASDDVRAAAIEFLLGLQLVDGLLVGALSLHQLGFGAGKFGAGENHLSVDLDDATADGFNGRLLL